MCSRDLADRQLERYYSECQKNKIGNITDDGGTLLVYKDSSLTIGKYGPIPLTDHNLTQQLSHFTRERIPERVVHAKGVAAFGYFEVTHDITHLTVSKVFESIGKRTPIAVRFSQVAGNMGSADTVRDPRGFAIKFYTEEGIWDLTGNNTPIFFMRDPILFPMFIHTQKRNPVTNLRNWDMYWDFLVLRPESIHQVMLLFADRGIPDGHRHQHGFGSHTFSLIGENRKLTWCKFIYKTDQGIKNLDPHQAEILAGQDPDYAVRDLYNAIEEGKTTGEYPSWTFYIQTMTPEQAKEQSFNPFDLTKVWPHDQFPLQQVGKLVLNQNPSNYFAEVEQLAFDPNNLTPGIGASPDRMLQGRLFAYRDAHNYRLGTNYEQLPVNRPITKVENFQRDGHSTLLNQHGAPNYHPNSFGGPDVYPGAANWTVPPQDVTGEINYYDLKDDDNYTQPREFWRKVLDDEEKERLVDNLAGSICKTVDQIQKKAIDIFSQVDQNLGDRLQEKLSAKMVVHL